MAATSGFLILLLLFLALPVITGAVLVFTSRRGGLGYPACGQCRYNVSATVGTAARCPECGAELAQVGVMPPKGRRNPLMFWLGLALFLLPLTCFGSLLVLGSQRTVTTTSRPIQFNPATRPVPATAPATEPAQESEELGEADDR